MEMTKLDTVVPEFSKKFMDGKRPLGKDFVCLEIYLPLNSTFFSPIHLSGFSDDEYAENKCDRPGLMDRNYCNPK